ncbi:MAG: MFS transporter [Phycisphaerae bacterium]|nr:MFS transporter [Phycisphaerae bacterium]NIU08591.1 MFS transporter [Phycisphaerae bacterium]NIX01245.1 MFS transporter [Phycisphaerae bacterium]
MKKIWPFTFYFLLYSAIAFIAPFIVLYYQELGFTGTQIGLLTGIVPLITLFNAPLWTGFADATHRHRLLMSLGILGGVITTVVFPFLNAFAPVFIIAVLLYIFVAPITPLADSATMFMLADEKEMYGRVRLGGTVGFGISAFAAGLFVQYYGLRFAFWGCAALFFLGLIVSQKLVYGQSETDSPTIGRARALLTNPRWVLFLVAAFAGGMGMAAYNNYLFPYMMELGASETTMGLALTVGMFSEIPILFFGNRLIKFFKSYGLLMLAMGITGLRMLLFATIETPVLVLFVQLLNGLTFPAMWVAGVTYTDENAPAGMSATAQGLFGAMVMGFGAAVGGFVGGLLLESIGGRGLYLVFGLTVIVIVVTVALIRGRLPAEN